MEVASSRSSGSRRSSRSRKSNQLGLAVRRIWSSTSTQPRTPVGFCDPFRCVRVHFAVGHRRATKTTVVYDFVVVVAAAAVIGARPVLGQRNHLARRRIRARRGPLVCVRRPGGVRELLLLVSMPLDLALHELRAKRRQIGRGVCRLSSWKAAGEWLKAHHCRRPSIRSAALCFHRSFRGVEENVLVRLVLFAVAAPRASFPLQGAHAPCPSECEEELEKPYPHPTEIPEILIIQIYLSSSLIFPPLLPARDSRVAMISALLERQRVATLLLLSREAVGGHPLL